MTTECRAARPSSSRARATTWSGSTSSRRTSARSSCGRRRRAAGTPTSSRRRSTPDGKVRGVPARIAHGVDGWHALELPHGVGLSTVVTAKGAKGGALSFQRLDADAHASAPPTAVVAAPVVSGDVEVVRAAGRLVFAWTDRTTDDPSVVAAALGDDGKVEAPHKVVEARGGAALLGLASGPAGTAMIWEAPAHHTSDARRLYSARIVPEPRSRRASLVDGDRRARGLPSSSRRRPASRSSPRSRIARPAHRAARMLRSSRRSFAPTLGSCRCSASPSAFGTDPASMAWGMTCDHDVCIALAASGASPARVRAAEVSARVNVKAPAEPAVADADAPKVTRRERHRDRRERRRPRGDASRRRDVARHAGRQGRAGGSQGQGRRR